jgi:hypothetical protein
LEAFAQLAMKVAVKKENPSRNSWTEFSMKQQRVNIDALRKALSGLKNFDSIDGSLNPFDDKGNIIDESTLPIVVATGKSLAEIQAFTQKYNLRTIAEADHKVHPNWDNISQ